MACQRQPASIRSLRVSEIGSGLRRIVSKISTGADCLGLRDELARLDSVS